MNRNLRRLAFLVAASGIEERAVLDALMALKKSSDARFLEEVRRVRLAVYGLGEQEHSESQRAYFRSSVVDDVVEQIINLLLDEAQLNVPESVSILTSLMESSGDGRSVPPFRPKEGFRSWLEKVAVQKSPSTLLHYAARIRNEVVHGGVSDWSLRDRGSD